MIPLASPLIPDKCKQNCVTPFGSHLGSHKGVIGFSNCHANCSNFDDGGIVWYKNETQLARDVFVGIRWQCVEYARRWLIINKKVAFADIDYSYMIFNLTTVEDLTKVSGTVEFQSFAQPNEEPPKEGDLIIYSLESYPPTGHVAIAAKVNVTAGYVDIAEQNWFNIDWHKPDEYARRVQLLNCDGKYVLANEFWNADKPNNLELCSDTVKIIGWKRVNTDLS